MESPGASYHSSSTQDTSGMVMGCKTIVGMPKNMFSIEVGRALAICDPTTGCQAAMVT